MNAKKTVFDTLKDIDVSKSVKLKQKLSYLPWAKAWLEVKTRFPTASYRAVTFDGKPYSYDENTGYLVFTEVTIEGEALQMWLPVMDGANKAMKAEPYTYKVKEYKNRKPTGQFIDKMVQGATMFDINKALMRCLVKNIAMFGLGLYIYEGEDLPEGTINYYSEMQLLAAQDKEIYKAVMSEWGIKSATAFTRPEDQQGLLKQVKDSIKAGRVVWYSRNTDTGEWDISKK